MNTDKGNLYNKSCYDLKGTLAKSIDALITDPPYGISYQNNYWDKDLPKKEIWKDCLSVLKYGSFGAVFSSIRLMHRLMVDIEDSGFIIRDVMFWAYLNGMPKSRDIALDIDKELGIKSKKVGTYRYFQGYIKGGADNYLHSEAKGKYEPESILGKKYKGCGLGIKPAYEPIILIQKPIEKGLSVSENMVKYGTGALNLEDTRIPYARGEGKVGHNPHPKGRVTSNIIRTDEFNDGYDKFFLVPKVRQHADEYNNHPTIKPLEIMNHLVKLLTWENQVVLDPFMGSGSTGVSCIRLKREFVGYEIEKKYFAIATKRMGVVPVDNDTQEIRIRKTYNQLPLQL